MFEPVLCLFAGARSDLGKTPSCHDDSNKSPKMLVLSRKEDQKVVIPGLDISIKVVRCKNSSVTLGFEAPPEIRIVRDELDSGLSIKDPTLVDFMNEKIESHSKSSRHDMRDQFNVVSMTLQMLLDDIESGELQNVDDVFDSVCNRLRGLKNSSNDQGAFVLVVEDEVNERELLAEILRMNGYLVATASNGNEALDFIEKHGPPAFILADMNMPGCDGAEMIRELRKSADLNNTRVYVVSGINEEECDLAPDSIDGWYTKPLAPKKLINAMANR